MTSAKTANGSEIWLLFATFLVAVSGLIYELIAATLSSYFLGDSIRQFSLVIGVFLSSMGLGAWLSRYVANAISGFVWAQIILGVIGGFLAPVLYFTFAFLNDVSIPLYIMLIAIGAISGMEIPLIARVLKTLGAPEFRFENVLTVDYIGALIASISFPILIIPYLGLMSASLAFGCLNLLVAGLSLWIFRTKLSKAIFIAWLVATLFSTFALIQSEKLISIVDANMFEDDIILSETTPYQQITITKFQERTRLFLNHSIQFDSLDEYRYHEALVNPAMAHAARRNNVLVFGGGDGMAVREVLRYDDVESVVLVDLDLRMTELFAKQPALKELNSNSLNDSRVEIINQDAWQFALESQDLFDVIIIDLPDPKNITLSKLYSKEFYAILLERITGQGIIVTQAGSPLFARQAYWSIANTFEVTRNPTNFGQELNVIPYHVYVPSFGDWGFVWASPVEYRRKSAPFPNELKFLTASVWENSKVFGKDISRTDAEPNSIQNHALAAYYNEGWDYWFR